MTQLAVAPPAAASSTTLPQQGARIFLLLSCGLLLLYSAAHYVYAAETGSTMGQSSGIIVAQAIDLADGVFYRPLISERGFGGTRYMPLSFVLIAPFIRLGLDPVNTAMAITLLADLTLLAGVYVLLRRLGVDALLAFCATALVLAGGCAQYAATTVRGDLLPAAMNVWGLAMICTHRDGDHRPRPILAAIFFTLAFTGKIVALYGVSAAVLALLLSRNWKPALLLAAATLLGMLAAIGLIHWASDGRFLENFRASATGGGGWQWARDRWRIRVTKAGFHLDRTAQLFLLLAALAVFNIKWNRPRHLLAAAAIATLCLLADRFLSSRINGSLSLLLAGAGFLGLMLLAFGLHRPDLRQVPLWALLITAVVTLGLFASPGVAYNILLDLHIIAVVFVVLQLARRRLPPAITMALLGLVALGAIRYLAFVHLDKGLHRELALAMLDAIGPPPGPILAKPPVLPAYAGEPPYVLDPWMFRHLPDQQRFQAMLYQKLREGYFRAIVVDDLDKEASEEGAASQFGEDFLPIMCQHYAEAIRVMNGKRTIAVIHKPKSQVGAAEVQIIQMRRPRPPRSPPPPPGR